MPGRRGDRRIPGGKERARLPDHLFQPGVQDELAAHVDRTALHYGNGAVCGDWSRREIIYEKILNHHFYLTGCANAGKTTLALSTACSAVFKANQT